MQNNKDFLENLDLTEKMDDLYEIQSTNLENNILNDENIINENNIINKSNEDIKNELDKLIKESNSVLTEEKKENNILSYFIGFLRYLTTSTLIFAILLLTTNYSAYYNIAKSYVFKDQLIQEQNSLLNSVNATEISKKIKREKNIKNKIKREEKKVKVEKYSIKKLKTIANQHTPKLDIDITPYENRIIIPKIAQNIPLLDVKNQNISGAKELENIFMKELEKGVIRYPGSTKPGRPGNTFIFGHSSNFPWIKGDFNDVFSLLDNVTYDDEIIMYYNQKKYVYKIKEKKVIRPGDVSILKRNKNKDELTVMTCWPVGTTLNRLIVVGELVKN